MGNSKDNRPTARHHSSQLNPGDEIAQPLEADEHSSDKPNARRSPSRNGTRLIAGHFDHSVSHQLRIIAAEEETTIQALLTEALDLLFLKRGKPMVHDLRNNNHNSKVKK